MSLFTIPSQFQPQCDVSLGDFELPFASSPAMEYNDIPMFQVGSKLIVGYLADDDTPLNPLEDCDGLGMIYSSHRFSKTHSDMQDALALDRDWEPDLGLVDDFPAEYQKAWVRHAVQCEEFTEWATETSGYGARLDEPYFRRRANRLFRESLEPFNSSQESHIDDFDFTDEVKTAVWSDLRSVGEIGDRDVQVLDCYSHGGEAWSLSGEGMQCGFDTATGVGVWVPDDCCREEVARRSSVYAFGAVTDNGSWIRSSGKKRYFGSVDDSYGGARSPAFAEWHEAFQWLETTTKAFKLPRGKIDREAKLLRGRERAAREIARSTVSIYNDWINGNTFGVVTARYNNAGTAEEPVWEPDVSDSCWGYVGTEDALLVAFGEALSIAEHLVPKAA